jgi:hypothetical protein
MKNKIVVSIGIFCFFNMSIQAQKLEYDIIWLGKIGKLSITKTSTDNTHTIETNSEVKIPFYSFNWITKTKSVNGQLSTAEYRQLLNQKKREGSYISFIDQDNWQFTNTDGEKQTIKIKDQFYVSRLYYQEPLGEKYIFSERFGKSLELIDHGNGHYKLLLPEDNYCEYFYENGICKIVKAKNGSRTIKMILSQGT